LRAYGLSWCITVNARRAITTMPLRAARPIRTKFGAMNGEKNDRAVFTSTACSSQESQGSNRSLSIDKIRTVPSRSNDPSNRTSSLTESFRFRSIQSRVRAIRDSSEMARMRFTIHFYQEQFDGAIRLNLLSEFQFQLVVLIITESVAAPIVVGKVTPLSSSSPSSDKFLYVDIQGRQAASDE